MDEKQALEIANKYSPEFVWEYAEKMHNGGWFVRSVEEFNIIGLPGIYIDPDGNPDFFGSAPSSWPPAVYEFIQLSNEEEDEEEYGDLSEYLD